MVAQTEKKQETRASFLELRMSAHSTSKQELLDVHHEPSLVNVNAGNEKLSNT